jgi:hypothetical protein
VERARQTEARRLTATEAAPCLRQGRGRRRRTWRTSRGDRNDRLLLLAYAQRPQDHDVPGGSRTGLHDPSGRYQRRRSVQARLPHHLAEQPHAGDYRYRAGRRRRTDPRVRVGAVLLYLAEKTGRFLPKDVRGRKTATEWLFWQVGGLGPMAGQNHHFGIYAPSRIPYAIAT